ncbi:ATPase family aaa domain-containing protein 1 [Phtheirospermum japonicum]|uniref:ATPase family aaa domain-containing protein 1 n=1 Tax=Phtheirospermum japonicum TaxID=374723 RepID=A0A830B318_9LAMI|nr:ATPase family aaa domain-containing protein 1 [Phtheirospermum japonicum]
MRLKESKKKPPESSKCPKVFVSLLLSLNVNTLRVLRIFLLCAEGKKKTWLQDLATDNYERSFVSAVVSPGETGVKFEDVGALEDVKKALDELVILPMKRPKLFSRGNLLRPCKGMLLFGPPGTGKTLIAKALATEAGAHFINITSASLTSKWYGEDEKYTRALFSFARKLTPVVIFMDEIDALLGARGGPSEHETTRRMRNEFMAAWDGLTSKDNERILLVGATNRPFDLDDAVIRRMPRR